MWAFERGMTEQVGFAPLPQSAAWRHVGGRDGFESLLIRPSRGGHHLDGHVAAVESGAVWAVRYEITIDDAWRTRSALIRGWSEAGQREVNLEGDGRGRWAVDGSHVEELDGCMDVDLEASLCTNTLPVHRLGLAVGEAASVPAAYVRAVGLGVRRLEQVYERAENAGPGHQYDYEAPSFGFACRLTFDDAGLVVDYPGLGTRVA